MNRPSEVTAGIARRPLLPWRVALSGGWMVAAVAAWPLLGAAVALSGADGVTPTMVLLELSVTGGLLIGICQLRRRGIPFRFRDQRGATMNVLFGASLTCGTPALVWVTAGLVHNVVVPVCAGVLSVVVNGYGWVAELRAWRRGGKAIPLMEQEWVMLLGAIATVLACLAVVVCSVLNIVGVLHWGSLF